ncbi:MAG: TatD family hydrolase [Steroidobacteraceae bacterium]|jgi:TatD DNase family protein|nr:TatD family hydrolase [Steroidobacteraceae bacterium]
MQFVDIGINLAHESYDRDREAVVRRALAAGVTRMVVTGASLESTRAAIALARALPSVLRATAGVHPHQAASLDAAAEAELRALAASPEVVAVGECGLDYHRNFSPPQAQRAAFDRQLALAVDLGKPVFLHQRDAHPDFVAILRDHLGGLVRGVAHCFTGNRDELREYLDLGLHVGITGWICDERRGHHLRELVRWVPSDRLMVETDGPYLLPRDLHPRPASRRNEPAFLPHVAAVIAAERGEALEALAAHTTATACRFFGLPAGGPGPSARTGETA